MSRAIELAKELSKDIDGLNVVAFSDQGSEFIHAFYAKAFDDGMARAAEICSVDPSAFIELLLQALEKWNASDS